MIIGTKGSFEASHFLPEHKGKCKNVHGHTYEYEIIIRGPLPGPNGMLIDFGDIKKLMKDTYDHKDLNDRFLIPTAENIVLDIAFQLQEKFKLIENNLFIKKIILHETKNNYVIFP